MGQNKLGIIYDERFLLHESPFYHAENPERLKSIFDGISKAGLFDDIKLYKPVMARKEQILLVHTSKHYNHIKEAINSGITLLDPDTFIISKSWLVSKLAAGSVITAVDMIKQNIHNYIFCLVRPPGHHAESGMAMGFCIFNNAALGAAHAVSKYGFKRVAIIDWDVHHGNGTQEIFYKRNDVLVINIHQFPLFPGTGKEDEIGVEEGEGFNINYPLPAGTTGKTYIDIFENKIIKKLEDYRPELIIISAGFDAHKNDPLAQMKLSAKDFGTLTRIVVGYAKENDLPLISVLEGGYNLTYTPNSVVEHLKEFIS
ncbi:MAG: histone deacetylase [Bacteroidota bacterium]|nr:histone deacetylase [Bacteroidota bacterium]